jgi:hypothetical protein
MSGGIPPLPQYAFMEWCSVKRSTGTTLPLPLECLMEWNCPSVTEILVGVEGRLAGWALTLIILVITGELKLIM